MKITIVCLKVKPRGHFAERFFFPVACHTWIRIRLLVVFAIWEGSHSKATWCIATWFLSPPTVSLSPWKPYNKSQFRTFKATPNNVSVLHNDIAPVLFFVLKYQYIASWSQLVPYCCQQGQLCDPPSPVVLTETENDRDSANHDVMTSHIMTLHHIH